MDLGVAHTFVPATILLDLQFNTCCSLNWTPFLHAGKLHQMPNTPKFKHLSSKIKLQRPKFKRSNSKDPSSKIKLQTPKFIDPSSGFAPPLKVSQTLENSECNTLSIRTFSVICPCFHNMDKIKNRNSSITLQLPSFFYIKFTMEREWVSVQQAGALSVMLYYKHENLVWSKLIEMTDIFEICTEINFHNHNLNNLKVACHCQLQS